MPRLLAIAELVGDPAAVGVTLPELRNEAQFAVVETGGQIDMALAAQLAGIDTDALYALNPGINRWATDPEGPHRLLLPLEQADLFTTSLAALGERELVQWTRHRVRAGETVGGIAERYQTTVAVLREINGLRGNSIRVGEYLMIPHASQSVASYTQSADARAARQQSTPRNGERREHVVQTGESLWSISRAYDVDVRSLASWNSMAPGDVLSIGRELVVWTDPPAQIAVGAMAQASLQRSDSAAGFAATNRIREITYVVRRGDSLSSIARRFKVSVGKLVEWNAGAADKYLQPGQRLTMFVDVTRAERLMGFLAGKRAIIIGLASNRSIAWGIAQAMRREGAELAFGYQNDKLRSRVEGMAAELGSDFVLPLDVADDAQIDAFFAGIAARWDGFDVLVHSVAFAPADQLEGAISTP